MKDLERLDPIPDEEVQKEWEDFWRPLVMRDGRISMEQIKLELFDYSKIMRTFAAVYEQLSGGRLSKLTYYPQVYIGEIEAHYQEVWDEDRPIGCGDKVKPAPMMDESRSLVQFPDGPATVYRLELMGDGSVEARIGWENGRVEELPAAALERV